MTCRWLFLASRTTPERFCDKPDRRLLGLGKIATLANR